MVSKVYGAIATREGRWWLIRVPEINNAITQARNAREIAETAAGVIQALLDLKEPPEVRVIIQLPKAAEAAWQEAGDLYRRAAADEQRAAVLRRQVVRQLLSDGWTQSDASTALGLSQQRVQQLAHRKEQQ